MCVCVLVLLLCYSSCDSLRLRRLLHPHLVRPRAGEGFSKKIQNHVQVKRDVFLSHSLILPGVSPAFRSHIAPCCSLSSSQHDSVLHLPSSPCALSSSFLCGVLSVPAFGYIQNSILSSYLGCQNSFSMSETIAV